MEDGMLTAKDLAAGFRKKKKDNLDAVRSGRSDKKEALEKATASARAKRTKLKPQLEALKKPSLTKEERELRSTLLQQDRKLKDQIWWVMVGCRTAVHMN